MSAEIETSAINATQSDDEHSESGEAYQTASDGEESEAESPSPERKRKRKRGPEEEDEPGAKSSKGLKGDKIPKNLRYGKSFLWAAVIRMLIRPMVRLDSKVSSPLPVGLVHSLWDVTTQFMKEHYPGAKFDSPRLPHKLSMVFPGREIMFRYGVKPEVMAAINSAREEVGLAETKGLNRVNMVFQTEEDMRRVDFGTPGFDAMHLLFQGDENLYQQLVTRWWDFIRLFEQNVKNAD